MGVINHITVLCTLKIGFNKIISTQLQLELISNKDETQKDCNS